jgi:serine protease Do
MKFDGKDVSSMRGLPRVVAQTQVGKTVDVELMRKGEKKVLKVVVGRLAEDDVASADDSSKLAARTLVGLKLAPMSDELKRKYGLKEQAKGVVVTEVEAGSIAAQREIVAGNVIVEAGGEPVATVTDISTRIEAVRKTGRKQILLSIEDAKGAFRSVALPFK